MGRYIPQLHSLADFGTTIALTSEQTGFYPSFLLACVQLFLQQSMALSELSGSYVCRSSATCTGQAVEQASMTTFRSYSLAQLHTPTIPSGSYTTCCVDDVMIIVWMM